MKKGYMISVIVTNGINCAKWYGLVVGGNHKFKEYIKKKYLIAQVTFGAVNTVCHTSFLPLSAPTVTELAPQKLPWSNTLENQWCNTFFYTCDRCTNCDSFLHSSLYSTHLSQSAIGLEMMQTA
jgi:hypothetical protein